MLEVLLLVINNAVPLGEGSSLAVLSTESDRIALIDQSGERQRLSGRDVYTLACLNRFGSPLVDLLNRLVHHEILGEGSDPIADLPELIYRHTGVLDSPVLRWLPDHLPRLGKPLGLIEWLVPDSLVGLVQPLIDLPHVVIHQLLCRDAFTNERFCILVEDRLELSDSFVHKWLGESRLVLFVMAIFSISH